MRRTLAGLAATLLALTGVASAHRLDEYLQATMLTLERDHVQLSLRLIPGVAVSSSVLATIDTDRDGLLSESEQRAYAQRVLNDLTLTSDGHRLTPRLISFDFPSPTRIAEGLGEIHIELTAALPPTGPDRTLILENHHHPESAAYLVNSLVPDDPNLRILTQTRNLLQSIYQVDYTQSGAPSPPPAQTSILDQMTATGFASLFHLGMRHIAKGTDHLLFLLVLLLPAPLLIAGTRWAGPASTRLSLVRILKTVTAFTLGHSFTLAAAALGFVHVPSRPIEVLIALSILVSAIHALRPIFPGKEAAIAAFFGLIHGLAFAATLSQLGLGRWERVAGILAFNLGIETMQLIVVAAVLPSLLLLSRTQAYPAFRIAGALFATAASLGWIAERLFGLHIAVDPIVDAFAHHGPWVAATLFLISLVSWQLSTRRDSRPMPAPRTLELG